MKTVTILYTQTPRSVLRRPFTGAHEEYQTYYELLYTLGEQYGIQFMRAPLNWVTSEGVVRKAWFLKNNTWEIKAFEKKPSVFWNKLKGTPEELQCLVHFEHHVSIINATVLEMPMTNKYATYLMFPTFFQKTWLVRNTAELHMHLKKIKEHKVVLKPLMGSGGDSVMIENPKKLTHYRLKQTMLLQKFIDTSHGIPGVMRGRHDMRIHILNNTLFCAEYRTPPQDSLIANVARGGSLQYLAKNKIPRKGIQLAKQVAERFQDILPHFYAIDMAFDPHGQPFLIELNAKPGVLFDYPQKLQIFKRLLREYFV